MDKHPSFLRFVVKSIVVTEVLMTLFFLLLLYSGGARQENYGMVIIILPVSPIMQFALPLTKAIFPFLFPEVFSTSLYFFGFYLSLFISYLVFGFAIGAVGYFSQTHRQKDHVLQQITIPGQIQSSGQQGNSTQFKSTPLLAYINLCVTAFAIFVFLGLKSFGYSSISSISVVGQMLLRWLAITFPGTIGLGFIFSIISFSSSVKRGNTPGIIMSLSELAIFIMLVMALVAGLG